MQHCCHWHVTAVRCRQANFLLLVAATRAQAQRPRGTCVRADRGRGRARAGEGESQNTDIIQASMAPIALNSINKINTFIAGHIINSSQA